MSTPVTDGTRWWVPGNRWDLVREHVALPAASRVAIIIPYFEQPDSLQRMYAALHVGAPNASWEVVVVDDGSRRPPPAPPATLARRVRVLRQDDRGVRPGAARHLGVAATDAEVLVFLDADTLPAATTVERLGAWPATIPDALVVGRRRHVDLDGWDPTRVGAWLSGHGETPPLRRDPAWLDDSYTRTADLLDAGRGDYRSIISAVMACHRVLYDDIGGFDTTRDEYGGEDWDLAARAYHHGAVLVHDPGAVAYHDEPDWEERSGHTVDKQREHAWLAGHTTDPQARGRGLIHPHVDVTTTVALGPTTEWQHWAGTVDTLLHAFPDQHVHLPAEADRHLTDYVAADPRVRLGPPPAAHTRRGLIDVVVHRPHPWTPATFTRLIEPIGARDAGSVRAQRHGELVAVARSNRPGGRARRAKSFGQSLPDDGFPTCTIDLDPEPLPNDLPGWLRAARP